MKILLTSFLLLFSTALYAQDPPEKYQKVWMELNEGDSEKAGKELEKIIKKKPNDPWPYWMLGNSLLFGPENEIAIGHLETAIAIDSTFAPAYYNLAVALDASDSLNLIRIEHYYTKAIQYSPKTDHYYAARAEFYLSQMQYDAALLDAMKAKEVNPESDNASIWFANKVIIEVFHDQNQMDKLKSFLALNDPNKGAGPEDPDYQYLLATIYESLGDQAKACKAYKQALSEQAFYDEMFAEMSEDSRPPQPEWLSKAKEKVKKCK